MAAPQIQGTATTAQQDTAVTSFTLNKPTGAAVDEYLFMFCRFNIHTVTFSDVQGFTQAIYNHAASANAIYVFYKKVDGTEGSSFTFVHGSSTVHAMMVRVSGVDLTTPIDDAQGITQVATVDNIDMPTVTTTGPDRLIFWAASNLSATSVNWTPDLLDTNELVDSQPAGNSAWAVTREEQASAGTSGTRNALWGGTGTGQNAVGVAVIPAVVVPTETLVPTTGGAVTNLSAYDATKIDELTSADDGVWLTGTDPSPTPGSNGPQYPTNAMVNPATGLATPTWTNGTNATDSSDTTTATVALAATNTDNGSYFSFPTTSFAGIPSGATIDAISLEIKHQAGTANRWQTHVQLGTANGTLIGAEKNVIDNTAGSTATMPSTLQTNTVDTFSAMPTRADLVSGTFGFRLRFRRSNTSTYTFYYAKMTVSYTPAGTTTNTEVRAPMGDPVDALATGAATGTIRALVRKLGSGSNPTAVVTVRNAAGTSLATAVASTAVSSTSGVVLSGTFDQSVISDKTDVVVWVTATGAAGGLVEVGAINWVAQTSAGPSPQTINLALQTVTASLRTTTVTPGAVSTSLALQTVAAAALTPTVVATVTIPLALQSIVASLRTATITPGAVSVPLALQALLAALRTATESAGGSPQTTNLALQAIAASLRNVTEMPGGVSTPLALQALAASLRNTTITPGGVSQALALQAIAASALTPTVVPGVVSTPLVVQALVASLLAITVDAGGGWTGSTAPDAIIALHNLSGTLADIDDDPDSPDANWLVVS